MAEQGPLQTIQKSETNASSFGAILGTAFLLLLRVPTGPQLPLPRASEAARLISVVATKKQAQEVAAKDRTAGFICGKITLLEEYK